jgi:hypothetical protein
VLRVTDSSPASFYACPKEARNVYSKFWLCHALIFTHSGLNDITNKMLQVLQSFIVIVSLHVSGLHCPSSGVQNCICSQLVLRYDVPSSMFYIAVMVSYCLVPGCCVVRLGRSGGSVWYQWMCGGVWYLQVWFIQHCDVLMLVSGRRHGPTNIKFTHSFIHFVACHKKSP